MPANITCEHCEKVFQVRPARKDVARFCSYTCRGAWRKEHWVGEAHPNFQKNAERSKTCQHCGELFHHTSGPITNFLKRKFCSKECGMAGQKRLYGSDNPRWTGNNERRKNRKGKHASWARSVLSRDCGTCQHCGATDVELHAHHIKPYADYPHLRWDTDNGLTLCAPCHWSVHSVETAKAVNSGDPLTGNAEGNPEPSHGRKPVEGVTTRGRAYRRWSGECDWCGTFISKRWSDVKGKKHLFCSYQCSGLHRANTRTYRAALNPKTPPKAVISSKSAARESDDIVWPHGKP